MIVERYKRSEEDIKSLQKRPRKMLIIIAIIMAPFVYSGLFGDDPGSIFALIFLFIIVCVVCYQQNRRIWKELADADSSAYILTDEGIFLESPTTNYLVPYKRICGVKIRRGVFNKKIVQVLLKDREGGTWNPLTSMEMPELFVMELRKRMEHEDCCWSE